MSYSNKNKVLKGGFSSSSAVNLQTQPEFATKKKAFARKPGITTTVQISDKQRKGLDQSMIRSNIIPSSSKAIKCQPQNGLQKSLSRQQSLSQIFYTEKEQCHSKNKLQKIHSSKSVKRVLFGTRNSLSKNSQKNNCENSINMQSLKEVLNKNSFLKVGDQPFVNKSNIQFEGNLHDVSMANLKRPTASMISLNGSYVRNDRSCQRLSNLAKASTISEKIISVECCYCKNNKKIVEILNEKYNKMEQQLNHKFGVIKELTDKYDSLREENSYLHQTLERNIEQLSLQETYYLKSKEELMSRIDGFKKEITKLNEKIKYNQIQNTMLLRLKNDYQTISRENDQLKHQNQQLKKQIIIHGRALEQGNFSKTKIKVKGKQCGGSLHYCPQPKQENAKLINIYYDCEDDNISLDLSEPSTDNY